MPMKFRIVWKLLVYLLELTALVCDFMLTQILSNIVNTLETLYFNIYSSEMSHPLDLNCYIIEVNKKSFY